MYPFASNGNTIQIMLRVLIYIDINTYIDVGSMKESYKVILYYDIIFSNTFHLMAYPS